MSGIAPLHAPPTARLCIQRNLLSQSKRIEIAMSVAFFISWARGASSGHAARPSGSSVHRADAR